jgi:SM-20-related protein
MNSVSTILQPGLADLESGTVTSIQALAHAFNGRDWILQEGFLPCDRVAALRSEAERLRGSGAFHAAGIGHGAERRADIRGDEILWFDAEAAPLASALVTRELEALRRAVNAATYLGLEDFEGHYAAYPPGAGYARHVDGFSEGNRRALSLVLYLNETWSAEDGGALRLHPEGEPAVTVLPQGGTLVCFLSERVPHEVLPAGRTRFSLAGWFRRRA